VNFAYNVVFVGCPLMFLLGFVMFRYPVKWAALNARFSDNKFDSPEQLAHTKQLGICFMVLGPFSLASVLAAKFLMASLK